MFWTILWIVIIFSIAAIVILPILGIIVKVGVLLFMGILQVWLWTKECFKGNGTWWKWLLALLVGIGLLFLIITLIEL